ncbi:hypothetical protein FOMPIDRAFT_1013554 [Fomitopsis schrenkii]|uniref:Uncharacterized protein n=1 Tax=Fomitopsis schrenkii TaxID=2126942 RepID=S8EJF7_FOMSC|nr:hypothetical protein FOMPIDRAFT_1013554 [Fomitopsis schrenkii]
MSNGLPIFNTSPRGGSAKGSALGTAVKPETEGSTGYPPSSESSQQGIVPYGHWRGTMSRSTLFEGYQIVPTERAPILPPLDTDGDLRNLPAMPAIEILEVHPSPILGISTAVAPADTAPGRVPEATTPPPAPRVVCRRLPSQPPSPVDTVDTSPIVLGCSLPRDGTYPSYRR